MMIEMMMIMKMLLKVEMKNNIITFLDQAARLKNLSPPSTYLVPT